MPSQSSIKVRMKLDKAKLDAIYSKSPEVADMATKDAADWVISYIKEHWSSSSPSSPGSPPAKLTGDLERSLAAERRGARGRFVGRGGDVTEWAVRADIVYAAALEFGKVNAPNTILPRPFMRPAVEALRQRYSTFFSAIINPRTKIYNSAFGGYVDASSASPVITDFFDSDGEE